jgi:xanthine dehydrogenase molybdopterin-binding subunit B
MRYDRDDDMTITGKRHDFRIDYEVGFDEDGASGPSTSSISPVAAGRWT